MGGGPMSLTSPVQRTVRTARRSGRSCGASATARSSATSSADLDHTWSTWPTSRRPPVSLLRTWDQASTGSTTRLRDLYGVGRVRTDVRTQVAEELVCAGLQVVSDPVSEPLIVRQVERQTGAVLVRRPPGTVVQAPMGAHRRRAVRPVDGDRRSVACGAGAQRRQALVQSETQPQTATEPPPATEPVETFEDAVRAADYDDYDRPLTIAAALGADEEERIRRKVSRRLAARAQAAVDRGRRRTARRLLREARGYPSTSQARSARTALRAADQRAAARRDQARVAREQRRLERQQARAQAEAERQAQGKPSARPRRKPRRRTTRPAASARARAPRSERRTSRCRPRDERDADGDGFACES